MSNSNSLAPYQSIGADPQFALQFIDTLGDAFAKGGIAGCKTVGQGKMLALTCLCDGITPLEFVRTYHLIDGSPSMRADAMLAEFEKAGGWYDWLNVGDDGKEAVLHVKHKHREEKVKYTIDHARQAKLVKPGGGWEKNLGEMLRARVTSKAIRMVAPEIVAGLYTPEELGEELTESGAPAKTQAKTPARPKAAKAKESAGEVVDAEYKVINDAPAAAQEEKQNPFGKPAPKDDADIDDVPFDEASGEGASGEGAAAKPAESTDNNGRRMEIRTLVGGNPELREYGAECLKAVGVGAVVGLSPLQAAHVAILLYSRLLDFDEKLKAALAKAQAQAVVDLDLATADKFLTSLRKQAKAAGK